LRLCWARQLWSWLRRQLRTLGSMTTSTARTQLARADRLYRCNSAIHRRTATHSRVTCVA